jgi:hypothetical protein
MIAEHSNWAEVLKEQLDTAKDEFNRVLSAASPVKAKVIGEMIICGICGHKIGKISGNTIYIKCQHRDGGHRCHTISKVDL